MGEELQAEHSVERIVLPYELAERTAQISVSALAKFHCSRLVQVLHDIET